MSNWIVVTKENNQACKRALLLLERAGVPHKEFRINGPSDKKPIVEQIGDFTNYPQAYYMDGDFPVHIGGLGDIEQYLALNDFKEHKINYDEVISINEVQDFSCFEG